MNITHQKYSCTSDLGAEILMVITSSILAIPAISMYMSYIFARRNYGNCHKTTLLVSWAYALSLPLMSYEFSQVKQYKLEGRAQVILIWMVLIESIRIRNDPLFTWGLGRSVEQLARLLWVGFLVYSYTPQNKIRKNLFILCICFAASEVLKAIMFYTAKNSYLIGKNPNLIHNYVKRIMLQDDLYTTPINSCDYIVMGENNHEIDVCSDGYLLGKKKTNSEGVLTIGRIFQFNLSEAVTWVHPDWRDTCLSLALAKMLRCRFAKLPQEEAGCRKALDFVQESLIDYIGSNRDIQTGRNLKQKPIDRLFSIIQEELMFVSDFLHIKVPTYNYFHWFTIVDVIGFIIVGCNASGLEFQITDWSSPWESLMAQGALNQCPFPVFRKGPVVAEIFSSLDQAITELLVFACIYIQCTRVATTFVSKRWLNFRFAKKYIKDPAKWNRSYCLLARSYLMKLLYSLAYCIKKVLRKAREKNFDGPRFYSSILDLKPETILFCIKVDVSIFACLPKWIRRIIPRSTPSVFHSTDTKEAILISLRNNGGRLTNGETSLKSYGMEHLKLVCHPNGSTTEVILVWHIATILFYQNNDPHQEHAHRRNNNPFNKAQVVALELSSYCHYLVEYLPELLPDEVEWTKRMYETVTKEVLIIPWSSDKKPRVKYRCSYILQAMWVESSVVGKGALLAKDFMNCADRAQVWPMLADFWAEMMLFIAPSDNVEAHEKLLERGELITQLWALLTHAGIVTRPKPTEHQDHESEGNADIGDMNV